MADQNIDEGTVSYESIIERPIATVWSVIKDFAGWAQWDNSFSYMKPIESEEGNRPTREYQMTSNNNIYQDELLNLDDCNYSLTYKLLKSAIPAIVSLVTTIKLEAVSDNQTKITWSGVSRLAGLSPEIIEKLRGVQKMGYAKHIEALSLHVAKQVSGL